MRLRRRGNLILLSAACEKPLQPWMRNALAYGHWVIREREVLEKIGGRAGNWLTIVNKWLFGPRGVSRVRPVWR